MDNLEQRLADDAKAIEARVSPQLEARIEASLHNAQRAAPPEPGHRSSVTLWWASSLTGLVTAALVIVLLNWNRESTKTDPVPAAREFATVPEAVVPDAADRYGRLPLTTRTADLTGPLEEELRNLKSDIEKARDNVEQDIRSSF